MDSPTPDATPTHYVLVTDVKTGGHWFLTPKGTLNRLRIHATRFPHDAAIQIAAEITAEHTGEYTAKAVPIDRNKKAR